MIYNIFIFIIFIFLLIGASEWFIKSLIKIAEVLRWKEFVVAFFIMAFAVSISNFFVGIFAALNNISEFSFGDVIGGNFINLTLMIGIAALISRQGLTTQSRVVQKTLIFSVIITALPLFLLFDGTLSRIDGMVLLLSFSFYTWWLFTKEERFRKIYHKDLRKPKLKDFFYNSIIFVVAFFLLILSAWGIVKLVEDIALALNLPLVLIGGLIIGFCNALPELVFSVQAAKKGEDWLVVGAIMGSIAVASSFVLGTVALINPIKVIDIDISFFIIFATFLLIALMTFLFIVQSGKKVTRKEGLLLIGFYVIFILTFLIKF